MTSPVRVLVVDDSAFQRITITRMLSQDPLISVIGTANNGEEAVIKAADLRPDVITLDVDMPKMNGLAALQQIMKEQPTPVIMLSAMTQTGSQTTVQTLLSGAVDFVAKPSANTAIKDISVELVSKVKMAAQARLYPKKITRPAKKKQITMALPSVIAEPAEQLDYPQKSTTNLELGTPLIIIGSSTGGPRALQQLLVDLPANLKAAVVIVQHMPAGFTQSLARRLNELSPLTVKEAEPGDKLACGLALLAPGDFHLRFENGNTVVLDQDPRRNHVRPSVNITMESLVAYHQSATIGVILTGMGSDGTDGIRAIKAAGGRVIAEHESTCVVFGMPRSVIEAGLSDQVVPLPDIAASLVEMVKQKADKVQF